MGIEEDKLYRGLFDISDSKKIRAFFGLEYAKRHAEINCKEIYKTAKSLYNEIMEKVSREYCGNDECKKLFLNSFLHPQVDDCKSNFNFPCGRNFYQQNCFGYDHELEDKIIRFKPLFNEMRKDYPYSVVDFFNKTDIEVMIMQWIDVLVRQCKSGKRMPEVPSDLINLLLNHDKSTKDKPEAEAPTADNNDVYDTGYKDRYLSFEDVIRCDFEGDFSGTLEGKFKGHLYGVPSNFTEGRLRGRYSGFLEDKLEGGKYSFTGTFIGQFTGELTGTLKKGLHGTLKKKYQGQVDGVIRNKNKCIMSYDMFPEIYLDPVSQADRDNSILENFKFIIIEKPRREGAVTFTVNTNEQNFNTQAILDEITLYLKMQDPKLKPFLMDLLENKSLDDPDLGHLIRWDSIKKSLIGLWLWDYRHDNNASDQESYREFEKFINKFIHKKMDADSKWLDGVDERITSSWNCRQALDQAKKKIDPEKKCKK